MQHININDYTKPAMSFPLAMLVRLCSILSFGTSAFILGASLHNDDSLVLVLAAMFFVCSGLTHFLANVLEGSE